MQIANQINTFFVNIGVTTANSMDKPSNHEKGNVAKILQSMILKMLLRGKY